MGPVTAQRIIDLRDKSGRFRRVEDLLAVRGITKKRLEAIRPYVKSPPDSKKQLKCAEASVCGLAHPQRRTCDYGRALVVTSFDACVFSARRF